MAIEKHYSYKDIANIFGISTGTVRRYINQRNVQKVKLSSRTVRFPESEVVKIIEFSNQD